MTILNSNKNKKRQFPGSKLRKIYFTEFFFLNETKFHKKKVHSVNPQGSKSLSKLDMESKKVYRLSSTKTTIRLSIRLLLLFSKLKSQN